MKLTHPLVGKLHFLLTILLACFPFFPLKIASIVIVVWGVVSAILGLQTRRTLMAKKRNYFLVFTSVFFALLLSLIWASELKAGGFLIERSLGLLVFPFSFLVYPGKFDERQINILLKAYIFACLLTVIKVYASLILFGFEFLTGVFYHDFRTHFEQYSGLHPTYASMLTLFAAILKLKFTVERWNTSSRYAKALDFLILALLVSNGLLLASRTPLAAFVVVLLLFCIHRMKNTRWVLPVMVVSLAGFLTAVQFFPSISSRVNELSLQNLKPPVGRNTNSVNIRAGVAICSVELLQKHWLLGLGAGSVQTALNNCYARFDTDVYERKDYNTHNQFLNYWLTAGLPALIAFLLALLIPMIQAYTEKQNLYFLFLVFFTICCLTENLLSRQAGVEFYALFNSLFAFNLLKLGKKKDQDTAVEATAD